MNTIIMIIITIITRLFIPLEDETTELQPQETNLSLFTTNLFVKKLRKRSVFSVLATTLGAYL